MPLCFGYSHLKAPSSRLTIPSIHCKLFPHCVFWCSMPLLTLSPSFEIFLFGRCPFCLLFCPPPMVCSITLLLTEPFLTSSCSNSSPSSEHPSSALSLPHCVSFLSGLFVGLHLAVVAKNPRGLGQSLSWYPAAPVTILGVYSWKNRMSQ